MLAVLESRCFPYSPRRKLPTPSWTIGGALSESRADSSREPKQLANPTRTPRNSTFAVFFGSCFLVAPFDWKGLHVQGCSGHAARRPQFHMLEVIPVNGQRPSGTPASGELVGKHAELAVGANQQILQPSDAGEAVIRVVGAQRLLPACGRQRRKAVCRPYAATQRDGEVAHGPRLVLGDSRYSG